MFFSVITNKRLDAVKEEKILYYRSSLKNQEGTWQKRGGGVLRWVDTPIHTGWWVLSNGGDYFETGGAGVDTPLWTM